MNKKGIWVIAIIVLVVLLVFFGNKNDDNGNNMMPKNSNLGNDSKQNKNSDQIGSVFHVDLEVFKTLLTDSKWQWVETIYSDDTIVTPQNPEEFSLVFAKGDRVVGRTDCNDVSARFKLGQGTLSFNDIQQTEMACTGPTQEAEFIKILERAQGFLFTADGALAITLEYDSGSAIFEATR